MFAQFFQLQSITILAIESQRHTLIISGLLTGFTCGSLTCLLKLRQFGTVPKTPHNCVKLRGSTNGCFYKHFPFSQKHRFPFCPSGSCAISKSKFVKYLNQQNFCQLNGCLVNSKVIRVFSLLFFSLLIDLPASKEDPHGSLALIKTIFIQTIKSRITLSIAFKFSLINPTVQSMITQ